jgi:hypothetical protein
LNRPANGTPLTPSHLTEDSESAALKKIQNNFLKEADDGAIIAILIFYLHGNVGHR